jgi:hypothetical protein
MLKELQDDDGGIRHDAFQLWRRRNPNGVFLTIQNRTKGNMHGARCVHLGTMEWTFEESGHSLTKKRKVLGAADGTLETWASSHSIEIHTCNHCVRDGFVSEVRKEPAEIRVEEYSQQEAMEGLVNEATILSRGRNSSLRKVALAQAKGVCEGCGVDFSKVYGGKGARVLQVHHLHQLALRDVPSITKLRDLAVVCANCHALIHADPEHALSVKKLRKMWAVEFSGS